MTARELVALGAAAAAWIGALAALRAWGAAP